MALRRIGVVFPLKNPKPKLKTTGKLQIPKKVLNEYMEKETVLYNDREFIEVNIGLFFNEKNGTKFYAICEFLDSDNEDSANGGDSGGEDTELPF